MWWYGFSEFSSPIETIERHDKISIYQWVNKYIRSKFFLIELAMDGRFIIAHSQEVVEKQDVGSGIGYCLRQELPLWLSNLVYLCLTCHSGCSMV